MHDEMRIGGKKLMELVKKQQQKLEVTINFLCSTVKYCWGKFMNYGAILREFLEIDQNWYGDIIRTKL
jgi:hypothetical protein